MQNTSDTTTIGVRISKEKHAKLREIAEAEHRTFSQELRRLIDERIREASGAPKPVKRPSRMGPSS